MIRFRKLSLIRQIVYLSLFMLFILLVSYVISSLIAKRIIEAKVTESVSRIFLQVEEKMNSFDSDMEGISTFLFYSPTVQAYLGSDDVLTRILKNQEVLSVFANTISLKENIRGIQLYDKDGSYMASVGIGSMQSVDAPVESFEYSNLIDIPISDARDSKRSFYAITAPIYKLDSNRLVTGFMGVGRFFMDATNFSPILKSAKVTASSQVMLLDRNNRTIASEGKLVDQDAFVPGEWQNNGRYIVQTITLPRSGWKLISLIPRGELLADLDTVKRFNIFSYAVMICILCFFLFIFFTRIVKPIKELMDFMKAYPRKGGESRFEVTHHNEIGVLGTNLNKMLDDIDSLSKEVQSTQARMYEIELTKKQMEISAFRNQINPHFLYNTLESIRAVALYHDVEPIADISGSLSSMFRYAVKGSNFVTVREEIAHAGEYANIIDFRFRGRFKIVIDAEEDVLEERMLKMLLQPIVENAVFHGLERKIGSGAVHIKACRIDRGRLMFSVSDDGYGMDEHQYAKQLDKLRRYNEPGHWSSDDEKGIGLLNIYRRIKLFYGDEAELRLESRLHEGTTVSVAFPASADDEQGEER
ncbi:sensor histidine kinase [Paenibacillus arenilitoris]|uniref:histidine kinase n=1 Tax=Paenibacillus arenilitoris TaxID=2772299 RepID=A0A927CKV3_9BACL|nr:histidine kinase [Paenibacillus arenilitoris]MBD2868627.1 histidine kinase [Paenibacillus arenilitoris]